MKSVSLMRYVLCAVGLIVCLLFLSTAQSSAQEPATTATVSTSGADQVLIRAIRRGAQSDAGD